MKPMQAVKGRKLPANTKVDILATYGSPIVLIQKGGSGSVEVILNDGEPLQMTGNSFGWEPLVPIYGTIQTDSSDVVIFV